MFDLKFQFSCLRFAFAAFFVLNSSAIAESNRAAQNEGKPIDTFTVKSSDEADARKLFNDEKLPSEGSAKSIGAATCGCIAGAKRLALDGPEWQVMRTSRNRYWGHPSLIEYIQKTSVRASKFAWAGILVGDMSMPRGGPMSSGHASHQRGTDVDLWLTAAPDHKLSKEVRETLSAGSVLKADSAEKNCQ